MPTHFPSGVSNVGAGSALFDYGMFDQSKYITVFDDFLRLDSGLWTTVDDSTGTATIVAGAGGILELETAATLADGVGVETPAVFYFDNTKAMFIQATFTLDNATLAVPIIGFTHSSAGNLGFAGVGGELLVTCSGVGGTDSAVIAPTSTSKVTVGVAYDPTRRQLVASYNGAITARLPATNLPVNGTALIGRVRVQAGSAAARTALVDNITFAQER